MAIDDATRIQGADATGNKGHESQLCLETHRSLCRKCAQIYLKWGMIEILVKLMVLHSVVAKVRLATVDEGWWSVVHLRADEDYVLAGGVLGWKRSVLCLFLAVLRWVCYYTPCISFINCSYRWPGKVAYNMMGVDRIYIYIYMYILVVHDWLISICFIWRRSLRWGRGTEWCFEDQVDCLSLVYCFMDCKFRLEPLWLMWIIS